MATPTRYTATLTATIAAALALTGCRQAHATTPTPSGTRAASVELAELQVRPEDTGAHYRRQDWGGWTRHHGCTTRDTVLIRDAQPGTARCGAGCRILNGVWVSSYDGVLIIDPTGVQIDHGVPVKEANKSGARDWTTTERVRFYNDPDNLVAVDGHANTAKGDRDPAAWRPADLADWCDPATGYIATKQHYRLAVDPAERAGLAATLATCTARQLPRQSPSAGPDERDSGSGRAPLGSGSAKPKPDTRRHLAVQSVNGLGGGR